MPKIDPETQKLYDEINGMIQKFKVNSSLRYTLNY